MMATNEILATIGPAAVAAGAAALVGLQGGQQLVGRYQAIATTAEALGGAYGKTTGSFLGVGGQLQKYQNLATGGVYELAGAGINILKANQGGASFGQMGLNTIAMIDRGVADMQINMAQRGTGAQLAQILSGGTGYLRQLGDIGSNVGNLFLGMAPHLPGIGGDYLSVLEGITGGLAGGTRWMNQAGLGDVLGAGLAAEAGSRIGLPLVGLAGRGLSGLGGLAETLGLGTVGESGLAGVLGVGGDALAALGGPEVAALAASAFLGQKLYASMPSGAERQVAGLQAGINQAGFTSAWQPLGHAITTVRGGLDAANAPPSGMASQIGTEQSVASFIRFGTIGPTTQQVYKNAMASFTQQASNLVNSGPQLQAALAKAGLKGASLADAFQIAQNSLLDLSHAFDKHGNLTKQAQTMLGNYVSTIAPMTQNAGAFGAAMAAQTVMSSEKMQDVSKVNQAMDAYQQIIAGGPTGTSALAAASKALPASAIAKALTSYTAPGSAAAWQAFASTSTTTPGVITQLQQYEDQMRTYMTLGTATPGQTAGLTAFQMKQMLPMVKGSPAALAMLMQQGAAMGVGGYYDTSKTQGQNYAAEAAAIKSMAYSSAQVKSNMDSITVHTANLPAVAKSFVSAAAATEQTQQVAKAAQDAMNIKGGINVKVNAQDIVGQLRAAGVSGAAALKQSMNAILSGAGVSKAMIAKIDVEVFGADQAKAQLNALSAAKIANKEFHVNADVAQALANIAVAKNAAESVPNITRYITYVVQMAGQVTGSPGGVPYTAAGIAANVVPQTYLRRQGGGLIPGYAGGYMVPGWGSGDTVPAMLEPGEAVVPRWLVPRLAPFLRAHGIPGFAAGGIPNAMDSPDWAAGGGGLPIPAAAQKVLDALLEQLSKSGAWNQVGVSIINGITYSLGKNATASGNALVQQAAAGAAALGHKVQAAFNLARNVAGAALYGQGFDSTGKGTGIFGSMDVTPGTGNGTVLEQMQTYLGTEQSFTKDLATLRAQHLSKAIIAQLVAAGPTQGDALAQSILNDYGGVKAVNATWNQMGQASKGLGAQAAMAQYGGFIAPNLKSGTFSSNNITINVNAPGGGSGNLPLTENQINAIVREIQARLLQQARRNNKTGLQARGKGS